MPSLMTLCNTTYRLKYSRCHCFRVRPKRLELTTGGNGTNALPSSDVSTHHHQCRRRVDTENKRLSSSKISFFSRKVTSFTSADRWRLKPVATSIMKLHRCPILSATKVTAEAKMLCSESTIVT